jgi:hypothetical protein
LGEIAVKATSDDMACVVEKVLQDVDCDKETLKDMANSEPFLSMMKTSLRGVERVQLLESLQSDSGLSELLERVNSECNDAVLICLTKEPLQLKPTRGLVNVTTAASGDLLLASDAFYPVALGSQATVKILDWSSVPFVDPPRSV